MENQKKMYRSRTNKVIAGVAAGLADYFNVDVVIFRLLFVLLLLFSGGGLLAYIILWIVIPKQPCVVYEQTAYQTAQSKKEKVTGVQTVKQSSTGLIAGIILIFLGILFLFDKITPWYHLHDFWPLIFVFAGIIIINPSILKSKNKENEI